MCALEITQLSPITFWLLPSKNEKSKHKQCNQDNYDADYISHVKISINKKQATHNYTDGL